MSSLSRHAVAHVPGRVDDCFVCVGRSLPCQPAQRADREGLVYNNSTKGTAIQRRSLPLWQGRVEAMAERVRESISLHVGELWSYQRQRRGRFVPVFVTLTYKSDVAWGEQDINEYRRRVAEWARRQQFQLRYTWVMELHKNGKPHYHVLFFIPARLSMPKADKRGWWPHGMSNTKKVIGSPARYMSKYLSKGGRQEDFPSGARMHGRGGHAKDAQWCIYKKFLPKWLREVTQPGDRWDRCKGGGFQSRLTLMRGRSAFELDIIHGGFVHLVQVAEGPRWEISPWDAYPAAA